MVFYENVLKRAKEKEQKEGISYPLKDGKLYTTFKIVYFIALTFGMLMNLFYIIGMLMFNADLPAFDDYKARFISVIALSVVMLGLAVASKFNANNIIAYIFGGSNLICSGTLIYIFSTLMQDDTVKFGIKISFYWRHLAPLLLVAISAAAMSLIVVFAYYRTKKAYNRVTEIIYDEYNSIPDYERPEWEEYLKNYEF